MDITEKKVKSAMSASSSKCSKKGIEGNTKTSIPESKKWTFTANNYTKEVIDEFCSICSNLGKYFFGYEVGESGTPHLQGFIELTTKSRPLTKFKGAGAAKWHWEKMKGSIDQSITYCSKDGNIDTNHEEWRKKCKPKKKLGCKQHEKIVLRKWQVQCEQIIQELALDDRKILWVWDDGNTGKSTFGRYLVEEYNTLQVNGAKKYTLSTIFQMKDKPELIVYALARSQEGYVSYEALEQIRDGLFFSGFGTKGTGMCNMGFHPVVVVLCNFAPQMSALSEDRWMIFGPGDFDV